MFNTNYKQSMTSKTCITSKSHDHLDLQFIFSNNIINLSGNVPLCKFHAQSLIILLLDLVVAQGPLYLPLYNKGQKAFIYYLEI